MNSINVSYGSSLVLILLMTAIAFFVYGQSIPFTIAFFILGILTALWSFISLIPFGVGGFINALGLKYWILPWIFSFTGLYESWLTSLLFWVNVGCGFFVSILITLAIFASD